MRFVEIEGLDGSGKATQSKLLVQRLCEQGTPAVRITFPDYEHDWSVFVRMYLNGEFGSHAEDVNAYTAASFYALDRYASYKKSWGADWRSGKTMVADRYVGSNLIHQMAKLPRGEWEEFRRWLRDFEFGKLGLPQPDRVLYLDMEPEASRRLLEERYGGDESKKDLHERDFAYLMSCREAAHYAVEREGWRVVRCSAGGVPDSIQEIHEKIFSAVKE